MKKNAVIAIIVLIILVGIVVALNQFFQSSNTQESGGSSPIEPQVNSGSSNIIEFTEQGYAPKELVIKQGDTVTFINKASAPTWPASAKHPTHTAYPGSGIEKCGTAEQKDIFDA